MKLSILSNPQFSEICQQIARQLHIPIVNNIADEDGILVMTQSGLQLQFGESFRQTQAGYAQLKPLHLDFKLTFELARKRLSAGPDLLVRAMGKQAKNLQILDATCGLAQDSILLLAAGFHVWSCERHPLILFLLQEAYNRSPIASWKLSSGDCREAVGTNDECPIIYIDPMFLKSAETKSATHKEMNFFRHILHTDPSAENENDQINLFHWALAKATQRVVVKRPLKGEVLGKSPTMSYKGKTVRYDVYITKK